MPPVVSIIISTFNRVDLLPATLESVRAQTLRDVEIIVVDDGSTDETPAYMETIQDTRVRYIRNTWSGHPSVNRNTGIRTARGEYIAFVDSDDLWLPNKLMVQWEYLQKNPETAWCFCHYDNFDHDSETTSAHPIPFRLAKGEYTARELLYGNFIGSPTPMVHRSLLKRTDLFDESLEIRFVEDWEFWLRLSAMEPAGFIPTSLALYRLHPLAATHKPDQYITAMRCLAAIQKAVALNPETYKADYDNAVEKVLTPMVKHLLVSGERAKARRVCLKASNKFLNTKKLAALYTIGLLPNPIIQGLLRANRRVKAAIGRNSRKQ